MEIKIYTAGACTGHPGPGGWSAIILTRDKEKEISGGEKSTTNNRMELTAAIKALEYCLQKNKKEYKIENIKIYTDSVYLKDGITIWVNNWEKNNWKTADKKDVKNIDLWKQLKKLVKLVSIEWFWIKGHSKNHMNDRADLLAKKSIPV